MGRVGTYRGLIGDSNRYKYKTFGYSKRAIYNAKELMGEYIPLKSIKSLITFSFNSSLAMNGFSQATTSLKKVDVVVLLLTLFRSSLSS